MTLQEKIVELLQRNDGMTDRELADVLLGKGVHQSPVNIACRSLKEKGVIQRLVLRGKIRNQLSSLSNISIQSKNRDLSNEDPVNHLSEDMLKSYLNNWLEENGWKTQIAWGHERGIDILATKDEKKWVIEVKGEGSLQPMRVNYFQGILGETLQRMDDPKTRYSIALPDIKQFRGLWERLPLLAKQRTGITILFIDRNGTVSNED